MNTNRLRFGCTLAAAMLAIGSFAAYMPEAEAGGVAIRLSTELVRFGDMPLGCVDYCDFVDTKFTLAPGQEHMHRFVLSDWHRFDAIGD